MIDGIYSQVGIKEDQSDLLQTQRASAPRSGRGFDRVLTKASRQRTADDEPLRARSQSAPRTRALREDSRREEPAAKARTRKTGAAPDEGEEKTASSGEKTAVEEEAQEGGRNESIQTPSTPGEVSETEEASLVPDGTALQRADEGEPAHDKAQAAKLAALGWAAYIHSPHGLGEAQVAAENGGRLVPQGARGAEVPVDAAAQETLPGAALVATESETLPDSKHLRKPEADAFELNLPAEDDQPAEESKPSQRQDLLNAIRQQPAEGKAPVNGPSLGLAGSLFMQQARSAERDGGEGLPADGSDLDLTAELQAAQNTPSHPSASDKGAIGVTGQNKAESQMVDRVAQDVKWMLRNDRHEVTIRLHPEHLGAMRLKVLHRDGVLRVEMTVDNHQARLLLESRLDDLHERLGQENLNMNQFTVNVNVQQGNDWDGARQMAQSHFEEPYPAWLREPPAPREAAVAPTGRPVWGRSGVGLYV